MVVTFCGHSDYSGNEKDEKQLLALLEKIIQKKDVEFFLGDYGNFDKFALSCVKKYKNQHPTAKLLFITPYLNDRLNKMERNIKECYDMIIFPNLEKVPKN